MAGRGRLGIVDNLFVAGRPRTQDGVGSGLSCVGESHDFRQLPLFVIDLTVLRRVVVSIRGPPGGKQPEVLFLGQRRLVVAVEHVRVTDRGLQPGGLPVCGEMFDVGKHRPTAQIAAQDHADDEAPMSASNPSMNPPVEAPQWRW